MFPAHPEDFETYIDDVDFQTPPTQSFDPNFAQIPYESTYTQCPQASSSEESCNCDEPVNSTPLCCGGNCCNCCPTNMMFVSQPIQCCCQPCGGGCCTCQCNNFNTCNCCCCPGGDASPCITPPRCCTPCAPTTWKCYDQPVIQSQLKMKYVQPEPPKSFKPDLPYSPPTIPLDSSTIYKKSYQPVMVQPPESAKPLRDNLVVGEGEFDHNTVHNMSYKPPGTYVYVTEPCISTTRVCYPTSCCECCCSCCRQCANTDIPCCCYGNMGNQDCPRCQCYCLSSGDTCNHCRCFC